MDELSLSREDVTFKIAANSRFRAIDAKIEVQEKRFELQKAEHNRAMLEIYAELEREESTFLRDARLDQKIDNYCNELTPGEYVIHSVYYRVFPSHSIIRAQYLDLLLKKMVLKAEQNNWIYGRTDQSQKIVFAEKEASNE